MNSNHTGANVDIDVDTANEVHEMIRRILPSIEGPIDQSLHLRDLGADSIDRVEIIQGLIGRFGLKVPMVNFSDIPTVSHLIVVLSELRRTNEH